ETITVSGESPIVDVQNTGQRNLVLRENLDALPTGARWLASFVAMTPGIVTSPTMLDVGGTRGDNHVTGSAHGSVASETREVQDGFEMNHPNASGSARVYNPNPGAAREVSVELGGGTAEYQHSGLLINFIPKEGSNAFSGDIFFTGGN